MKWGASAKAFPESQAHYSDLGKVCPRFVAHYSDPGKVCPESGARLCPLCISMNRIQGKVYPPWGWLARNLRHNNTSSEWLSLLLGR